MRRWRLITLSRKFPSPIDNENIDEIIFISLTWNPGPTRREKIFTILDLFIFFIKSWGSTGRNLKTGSINLKALFCLFSFFCLRKTHVDWKISLKMRENLILFRAKLSLNYFCWQILFEMSGKSNIIIFQNNFWPRVTSDHRETTFFWKAENLNFPDLN